MISFESLSTVVSGTDTRSGHMDLSGIPARQLLLAVFAFEDVAAGSGPYIEYDPNGAHPDGEGSDSGWYHLFTQAPSATGNGLEVWCCYWGGGSFCHFKFSGSYSFVGRTIVYAGVYDPGGDRIDPLVAGAIRSAISAQVTGDDPACPGGYAFTDELLVALAGDQLQSPGFGTPTPAGWTSRFDSSRGGSYGNVELTAADSPVTGDGDTGSIPFDATAAAAGTKGATATLFVRPADAGSSDAAANGISVAFGSDTMSSVDEWTRIDDPTA